MVGPSRFELKTQLPKSCVLPLHHRPIKNTITIVAEAGLEPARSLLTRRFSCHTCFYTSQLNQASLQPTRLLFSLQEFHHNLILETFDWEQPCLQFLLSCCSLDYFSTMREILQVGNTPYHQFRSVTIYSCYHSICISPFLF